jgi:hypothetical protein
MHSILRKYLTYIAEVGFFVNGALLSNNSVLMLRDIGEGSSALYCLTDREQCCRFGTGGADRSLWSFPDGTSVGEDATADIYFTRGFSSLLLNRRSSAEGPTGIYTCVIPDRGDDLRTLHIGLYGGGEFLY